MKQCAWLSREKLISGLPLTGMATCSLRPSLVCNELTSSIPTLEFGPYKYLELQNSRPIPPLPCAQQTSKPKLTLYSLQ